MHRFPVGTRSAVALFALVLVALFIAACSGGGSGPTAPADPARSTQAVGSNATGDEVGEELEPTDADSDSDDVDSDADSDDVDSDADSDSDDVDSDADSDSDSDSDDVDSDSDDVDSDTDSDSDETD